jgi:RND family efflux transporter MFP subunit
MTRKILRWIVGGVVLLALAAALGYRLFVYAVPVEVARVTEGAVEASVTGPGTVQARIPVTLGARTTSNVTAVHVDQGDAVKRGQLLAQLDDRDLAAKRAATAQAHETVQRNIRAAEASLAKAQSDAELAESNYRRDLEIFKAGYIAQAALDTAGAGVRAAEAGVANAKAVLGARQSEALSVMQETRYAEAMLTHTRIVAPMDGIVVQRLAEVGATTVPGTPLFKLVDPATVWVAMRVDESVVSRVTVGLPARIRLRTGEVLNGKVARIARQSDAATRELQVDIAFEQPPQRFAIDQEAHVSISAGKEPGLAVPAAAVIPREGRSGVLVVRDGRARFQPIELGTSDGANVLALKGLDSGDLVMLAPDQVKPGTRVRAHPQ